MGSIKYDVRVRVLSMFTFACIFGLMSTAVAYGQTDLGVDINQFKPSVRTTDGFMTNTAEDQGHLRFGATLFADYSRAPLSNQSIDVISNQISSRLLLSFGLFDRIILFGGFKFHLLMDGDDTTSVGLPRADGAGVGDAVVGARFRLHGTSDDAFQFAFQGKLALPLGEQLDDGRTYGGEHTLMGQPEFLFQFNTKHVHILANVGFRLRGIQNLGTINIGHELTWALGAMFPVMDERLDVIAEFFGATRLKEFFAQEETPAEVLAGVKYHFGPGVTVGGGLSAGLTKGYGSPDVRVFAMLGFEQGAPESDEEEVDPEILKEEKAIERELDAASDSESEALVVGVDASDVDNPPDGSDLEVLEPEVEEDADADIVDGDEVVEEIDADTAEVDGTENGE